MDYAKEAALYTTKGGLGELVFAPNYKGENDVAIFDFTGMMYSDNASKILERKGKRLLLGIAGDSLFEVSCWCLSLYREIFVSLYFHKFCEFCSVTKLKFVKYCNATPFMLPMCHSRKYFSQNY